MPASLIIDRFYSYVKSQQIEKFFGPDMFWVLSKKILYPHWVLNLGSCVLDPLYRV